MNSSPNFHKARKRFGQNFLKDEQVIDQIVNHITPLPGDNIVEIGPGLGAITTRILDRSGHIQVVELDRDIIPKLIINCHHHPELTIHQADALKVNFDELTTTENQSLRVIGNLPYNISTPILFHLFSFLASIEDMHFMLQKEVVQRMAAEPGSKRWGRLSIMVQYHCQVENLFEVPPQAFTPQPKVDSAIVRLTPYQQKPHLAEDLKLLDKIVVAAFSQRRKTIRNALKKWFASEELLELGIQPTLRPEQLTLAEFVAMSNYYHNHH